MILVRLAFLSLRNRWLTALLTVLAVGLSVCLFLGVEKVRNGARASFADTISGTDLIVGARTGSIQLLLYSVFGIGTATNNMSWGTFKDIARRKEVAWIVPLTLGDSHRGFRVIGTSAAYFARYKYRSGRNLEFAGGKPFDDLFDAVFGADAAARLGYKVGDRVVISHGLGDIAHTEHDNKPFRVSGILAKTGTPVDRAVLVSVAAIEAIHFDWMSGAQIPGLSPTVEAARRMDLTPRAITAALVGLTAKSSTFELLGFVNDYEKEPLLAILPGVALQELWGIVATAEQALMAVSAMVVVAALFGMATMMLSTLNERRREMAILRSLGARPRTIVALLMTEAGLLSCGGTALGSVFLYILLFAARPVVDASFGLYIPIDLPSKTELLALSAITGAGVCIGALPALRAYRMSITDGMTVRH